MHFMATMKKLYNCKRMIQFQILRLPTSQVAKTINIYPSQTLEGRHFNFTTAHSTCPHRALRMHVPHINSKMLEIQVILMIFRL